MLSLKKFLPIVAIALFVSAQAFADTQYSTVITDLPLMTGMVEMPDQAVTFDNPDGHIMETAVSADMNAASVMTYYQQSLPPLGWKQVSNANDAALYTRGNEKMTIDAADSGAGKSTVQFKISSDNASQ